MYGEYRCYFLFQEWGFISLCKKEPGNNCCRIVQREYWYHLYLEFSVLFPRRYSLRNAITCSPQTIFPIRHTCGFWEIFLCMCCCYCPFSITWCSMKKENLLAG